MRTGKLATVAIVAAAVSALAVLTGAGGGKKVPVDRPTFVQGTGTGLTGIYWDNPDFTDHRISRVDPVLDFSWGAQTPDPSISAPTFSARWVGQVQAQHSEVYTFIIEAPGGYDGTVILNEQVIIDSQNNETTIVYSTPTALAAGQWYDIEVSYKSYGGTAGIKLKWSCPSDYPGGVIPQLAMNPTILPAIPGNLRVVSTGAGKIRAYWEKAIGASGYNLYRATTSGGQNFFTPVNGSTPITTTSYSGGEVYTCLDNGLTNGATYFYRVKAVYGTFEGSPSNEDSETVDPNGIPWDATTPSPVLAQIRSDYSGQPAEPGADLRVVGPDGRIYAEGQSNVLPPEGTFDPQLNCFVLQTGARVTPPTTEFDDSIQSPPQSLRNFKNGPYRRVLSSGSYVGACGFVTLPSASTMVLARRIGTPSRSQDSICHMFGSHRVLSGNLTDVALDAGPMYYSNGAGADVVVNYMLIYPKPSLADAPKPILVVGSAEFAPNQTLEVIYMAVPSVQRPGKTVAICVVKDDTETQINAVAGFAGYKSGEVFRVKRMHSIAQNNLTASQMTIGYASGTSGGSYCSVASFAQGQLIKSDGSMEPWTTSRTYSHGSFPLNSTIVSWFEASPFITESSIKLDLR